MRWFLLLILILCISFAAAPVDAAAWTVGKSGLEDYTTIQAAVDAASSGDSIYVHPGNYTENIQIGKTVNVYGMMNETGYPYIDAGQSGSGVTITGTAVNLSGFNITNSNTAGIIINYGSGLIANNSITRSGFGIKVLNTTNTIVRKNRVIKSNSIYLASSSFNQVSDNIADGFNTATNGGVDYGLEVYTSENNVFSGNTVKNYHNYGNVYLKTARFNSFINNSVTTGDKYGFRLQYSDSNLFDGNYIFNTYRGMVIETSRNTTMRNNAIGGNLLLDFDVTGYFDQDIDPTNTVSGKPVYYWRGAENRAITKAENPGVVYLINCNQIVLSDFNITSNGKGVYTNGSSFVTATNVSAWNNLAGIVVDRTTSSTFDGGWLSDNYDSGSYYGIHLKNADTNITVKNIMADVNAIYTHNLTHSTVAGNTVFNSKAYSISEGIYLSSSQFSTIQDNFVDGYSYGIDLRRFSTSASYPDNRNNTLSGNTVTGSTQSGIYLKSTHYNNITANTVRNSVNGLTFSDSGDNRFALNVFDDNTYNIDISSSKKNISTNLMDTTNLVEGLPVYWLVQENNIIINETTPAGAIAAFLSDNITISNQTISRNSYGVYIDRTSNVRVSNVTASLNRYGIYINSSTTRNIVNQSVVTNSTTYGMWLERDADVTIANSTISDSGTAFYLSNLEGNLFFNNTLKSRGSGTALYLSFSAHNNTFTRNNISQFATGIYLSSSDNNALWLNNFINCTGNTVSTGSSKFNSTSTQDYEFGGTNYSSIMGNFWSGYTGSEGTGGIGTTTYLSSGINDVFPLAHPFQFYSVWEPLGPVPPTASFTASPASGSAPLTVQFTDSSTGSPTQWNWSFGDGNLVNATVQNPVHRYANPGKYTVSLNATNAEGSNIVTRVDYITVRGPAPVPGFTASTTNGTAPLTVTFTDLSTSNPTGWAWYFGEENYTAPWTLLNGSAGWAERYSHSTVMLPDGTMVISGGISNVGYKNDSWRSTDGGTTWALMNESSGWNVRYNHRSVVMPDGSIILMGGRDNNDLYYNDVWMSDDQGERWVRINASAGWSPRSQFSAVVSADGSILVLGGQDNSGVVNDTWRSADSGATWARINTSAGWGARSAHSTVVLPGGTLVLTGGAGEGGYLNDTWQSEDDGTTWTRLSTNAEWSARRAHGTVAMPDDSIVLMGGNGGAEQNDIWRSTDHGASWTQVNASAGWDARNSAGIVMNPDSSIVLLGGYDSGILKNDVWHFSPAGSTILNPTHTYTIPGIYPVALQTFNDYGANSTRKSAFIRVWGVPPSAGFTANATFGLVPMAVRFTDSSTGTVTRWNWSFGDGVFSEARNPVYTYNFSGNFTVSLNVSSSDSYDIETKTSYINVDPVPSTLAKRVVPKGGTVFIGESGLNVTSGLGTNTTIAWFTTGIDGAATEPNQTYEVAGFERNFAATQANFSAFTGNWYSWSGGSSAGGAPLAFLIADPALEITVTDVTTGGNPHGKTIPVGDDISFTITSNLATLTERGIEGAPVTLNVRGPDGTVYTSLTDQGGKVASVHINVSTASDSTGAIWDTGKSLYPAGTYNITATSTINGMNENYPVSGKTIGAYRWFNTSTTPPPALPPPTVTTLTPATGSKNTTIAYVITGKDFEPGSTTVEFRNQSSGIVTANVTNVTATRLDGNVTFPANAVTGSWNVRVITTSGGEVTLLKAFTLTAVPRPTVTTITPSGVWNRNSTVNYTITGTNFKPGNTLVTFLNASGTALNATGSGVWLVTPTQIFGTVVVPYEASSKTPWNISVVTSDGAPGGKTGAFTVGSASKPTVTAITPAGAWARNTTVNYTITGTNFQPGNTEVTLWNTSGVLLNATGAGVWLVEPTKIYGTVVVPYEASSKTAYNVTVSTYNGGVGGKASAFMVGSAAKPTVTAITPAGVWARNSSVAYTITGTNFQPDNSVVTFWNTTGAILNETSGSGVTEVTATTIKGTVVVPFGASSSTPYNVTVSTYNGGAGGKPAAFTVGNSPSPAITAVTPASGIRNSTVSFTVTGSNFQPDQTTVTLTKAGSTDISTTLYSVTPTQITGAFEILPNEDTGSWKFNVTTLNGGTRSWATPFTISAVPPPTVSTIYPSTIYRGTTVAFMVKGSNFQTGGRTIVLLTNTSGYNITTTLTSVYGTQISGTTTVPDNAVTGVWKLNVTTLDGGTGTKADAVRIL